MACLLFSCNHNNNTKIQLHKTTNQIDKNPKNKSSEEINENNSNEQFLKKVTSIKDVENLFWRANHSDNTNYSCEIGFYDEYAIYRINYQCYYYFFTNTSYAENYQQIELLWTYKEDCKDDMTLFKKAHGVKKYPKNGDVFSVYKILNDTTLIVEYKFPEWVEKVNQIANDSLFPKLIYLKDEGL